MRKRLLAAAMATILLASSCLGFVACSKNENPDESNTGEETEIMDFADITAQELVAQIRTGWNLGNTLDSTGNNGLMPKTAEMSWGNPKTTQEMIDAVRDAGFNAIRIPVTWQGFTVADNNTILPMWMDRVQEVVDYAIADDMYVILNTHHEEWVTLKYDNLEYEKTRLTAIWEQIGDRFKGYDEHLIFEDLNEPRCVGTPIEWTGGDDESHDCLNQLNAAFVETVRATGGNNDKRLLMVPVYAASSTELAMSGMVVPEDDMICVSIHAYIPYNFALAYPGQSSWETAKDRGDIDTAFDNMDRYFISKGIPVIMGEYGAVYKDNDAERLEWITCYLEKANETGVPCFWWDNNAFHGDGEILGLFNRNTLEWEFPDLLDAIMKTTESRI